VSETLRTKEVDASEFELRPTVEKPKILRGSLNLI